MRGAAQRSLQCSPCNDKQYSLSFFKGQRSAAQRGVWYVRNLMNIDCIFVTCARSRHIIMTYLLYNAVLTKKGAIWANTDIAYVSYCKKTTVEHRLTEIHIPFYILLHILGPTYFQLGGHQSISRGRGAGVFSLNNNCLLDMLYMSEGCDILHRT